MHIHHTAILCHVHTSRSIVHCLCVVTKQPVATYNGWSLAMLGSPLERLLVPCTQHLNQPIHQIANDACPGSLPAFRIGAHVHSHSYQMYKQHS